MKPPVINKEQTTHRQESKQTKPRKPFEYKKQEPKEVSVPSPMMLFTEVAPSETEAVSQVAALEQKIAASIVHMKKDGIDTLTVSLTMPGSDLDGTEITLQLYDTAPMECVIQFATSPAGAALIAENMESLDNALHKRFESMRFRIRSPRLKKLVAAKISR